MKVLLLSIFLISTSIFADSSALDQLGLKSRFNLKLLLAERATHDGLIVDSPNFIQADPSHLSERAIIALTGKFVVPNASDYFYVVVADQKVIGFAMSTAREVSNDRGSYSEDGCRSYGGGIDKSLKIVDTEMNVYLDDSVFIDACYYY